MTIANRRRLPGHTERFLAAMEQKRRSRPWRGPVDMRGKVPYRCTRYRYGDHDLWLDERGAQILARSIEEHGILTVGACEEIMALCHARPEPQPPAGGRASGGEELEVEHLGYFFNRSDRRVQFATPVHIHTPEGVVEATTRDLSLNGLGVHAPPGVELEVGEEVLVDLPCLSTGEGVPLERVPYRVMKILRGELRDTLVLLRRPDAANRVVRTLERVVEERAARALHDAPGDAIETASALLTEIQWAHATSQLICLFSGGRLVALGHSSRGCEFLEWFENEKGRADLSPLRGGELFQRLLTKPPAERLLHVMRRASDPQAMVSIEEDFSSRDTWKRFLKVAPFGKEGGFYQLRITPVRRCDPRKLYLHLERLAEYDLERAEALVSQFCSVSHLGVLIRVDPLLAVNGETERPAPDFLSFRAASRHPLEVPIHLLDYEESRGEDRYRVRLAVRLETKGEGSLEGETRDISLSGLSVELPRPIEGLRRGRIVQVTFPLLHRKVGGKVDLRRIPYAVMATGEEGRLVALARAESRREQSYHEFFTDLIERNRESLELDLADLERAATGRCLRSFSVESFEQAIALVFLSPEEGERRLLVALPPAAGWLGEALTSPSSPLRDAVTVRRLCSGESLESGFLLDAYGDPRDPASLRWVPQGEEREGDDTLAPCRRLLVQSRDAPPLTEKQLRRVLEEICQLPPRVVTRLRQRFRQVKFLVEIHDLSPSTIQ